MRQKDYSCLSLFLSRSLHFLPFPISLFISSNPGFRYSTICATLVLRSRSLTFAPWLRNHCCLNIGSVGLIDRLTWWEKDIMIMKMIIWYEVLKKGKPFQKVDFVFTRTSSCCCWNQAMSASAEMIIKIGGFFISKSFHCFPRNNFHHSNSNLKKGIRGVMLSEKWTWV